MTDLSAVRVLVIDDESQVCTFFTRLLSRRGWQVVTAQCREEAEQALRQQRFAVALVDLKLPDTDGLTLLQLIKAHQRDCEVVLMTGYSTVRTAIQAMQLGAYEYLEKPFDDIGEIETLLDQAVRQGGGEGAVTSGSPEWEAVAETVGFLVGKTAGMQRLASLASRVARKTVNVLIQGRTGSGKEVLARFLHAASPRAEQPFIAVNCGALPEHLLESELFGHEKGAFTGAGQARRGIFELAHGGTLFLDEIGDASPMIQVRLLRVLESGEFTRVGGEKPIRADVRLVAATHVDLEAAVEARRFREDLYYRLNVVRLELPDLQERREDIPALAERLLHRHHPELTLDSDTLRVLQGYSWPGNIRELANVLRGAAVLCSGKTLYPEHLGERLHNPPQPRPTEEQEPREEAGLGPARDLQARLPTRAALQGLPSPELNQLLQLAEELAEGVMVELQRRGETAIEVNLKAREAEAISRALDQHHWNITHAARSLGIARNTLHRKIKQLGLR